VVQSRLTARDKLLALGAYAALTLAFTYPLALRPASANRLDSPDALLNSWIVSWCLYQIPRDPLRLFDANIFYPENGTLALSENLLTGALLASPAALFSSSPVVLFNVALVASFVLSGYAAYLLAHDLTGSRLASGLAGILFAFAPYRFAHIPHLQLQLAFGIPLSLYFARRIVEGGFGLGPVAGLASSVPLTFGSSVYYAVYGATAVPVVALFELRATKAGLRLAAFGRTAFSAAAGMLLTLPLALPYWSKMSSGLARSLETASEFEASGVDYVSSLSRLHGFLPKTSEPLFPGFVALTLAAVGLAAPSRERQSTWLWIAIAALGVALSLGPSFGLFSILYEHLPPYRALRVPSRAGILFLLGVAMLAALGLRRIRGNALRIGAVLLATAECWSGPLPLRMEAPVLPPIYRHLQAVEGEGALLELPLPPPERFQDNAVYVYRSAYHRRAIVNGYSGFVPESYRETFEHLRARPLAGLVRLSRLGVRFVLAHEARLGPRMRRELREAELEGILVVVGEEPPDRLYRIELEPGGLTARSWSRLPGASRSREALVGSVPPSAREAGYVRAR
jgi:hypothetical protein